MKLSTSMSKALLLLIALGATQAEAGEDTVDENQTYDNCLLRQIHLDSDQTDLEEIKIACQQDDRKSGTTRHEMEKKIGDNPFSITPYRQNYFLPATHMTDPNTGPYTDAVFGESSDDIMNQEIKFQISFKVPIVTDGIFNDDDEIYFGFTLKSFWQAYAGDISSPFRDTNYRPEIFYESKLPIDAGDGIWFTRVGFEHESNGRTEELSRSWNRIYAGLGYEEEDFMVYLEPWYNMGGMDSDNKDIEDYLGHYELTAAYKVDVFEFTSVARYNFSTGYGGIEAGMSFPLLKRVRGYVQYYQGYGESLIDYNYNIQRIGVGIILTDII
ncbi:phospholipase A [Vibrio superstes]|uniref:Phospholipase A1 n=1 Tax=Vibrio superstes NBRC 103154 TaxID=1219062 RepID=A0A511QKP5_9VIBR|nr:phospholipase A [Vibrio superstes]GEM77757.1 phospholipase [Vibrio superstes NBRC 103154]